VRDGRPRRLLLEDDLRLLVELGAALLVGDGLRLLDQLLEVLVAPLGAVGVAYRVAAEEDGEEVVRVAVVARPAEEDGTVTRRRRSRR
jgi:hypothetical protein